MTAQVRTGRPAPARTTNASASRAAIRPDPSLTSPQALTAARIGMLSAFGLAIVNVWFWVGFILYAPVLQAPWRGMNAYVATFVPSRYLAWAVPAFLFAPAFLTMIACLHEWANQNKRTWSLLALVFALPGATLMAALYYIQMTVVPNDLVHGVTMGFGCGSTPRPTRSPFPVR